MGEDGGPCVSLAGCGGFDKPGYIPSPSAPHHKDMTALEISSLLSAADSHANYCPEVSLYSVFPPENIKHKCIFPLSNNILRNVFSHHCAIRRRPPEFPLIFKRQPNSASFFLSNKLFLPLFFSISWGARSSWEWVCGCWWTPQDFGKSWQPTPCCSPASTSSWAWEACSSSWASSAAAEPSVKTSVCCSS